MSDGAIQKEVRQRDRFICPNCTERKGEQYAHIDPGSEGGDYVLDNLLFLCQSCHNQLEVARSTPEMKEKLIALGYKLRDRPKRDGLFRALFTLVAGEYPVIALGGGMRITTLLQCSKRKITRTSLI